MADPMIVHWPGRHPGLILQPEIVTLLVRERLGDGLSRRADEGGHR
jgi:hypothetical protein